MKETGLSSCLKTSVIAPHQPFGFELGPRQGARGNRPALDPDALVIDTTDGWAAITVAGDGARASFGLLSRLELPDPGFTQGEVVHVPAKVVARDGQVLILAPSMWEAHLQDRVTKALGGAGRLETRPWTVPPR